MTLKSAFFTVLGRFSQWQVMINIPDVVVKTSITKTAFGIVMIARKNS